MHTAPSPAGLREAASRVAGGVSSRTQAGGARAPGPCARPLPWERTQLARPRERREEAPRQIQWETLSQDGVCEAAGCGVSAPRRGLCEAAPLPAAAATAAPPLRPPLRLSQASPPGRYRGPCALRVVHRWQRQVPARRGLAGLPLPGAPDNNAYTTFSCSGPLRPGLQPPRAPAFPPRPSEV